MSQKRVMKVIECQGTPYEIGLQYGEGCRDSLLRSIEVNFGILTAGYKVSQEQLLATAKKYLPRVEAFDPQLVEMPTFCPEAFIVPPSMIRSSNA